MSKILVIEDEEDIRDNILDLLEAEGYDAVGAENGQIGVEVARQELPEIIICDVMMPVMDGFATLNALRQDVATQLIPFIFLTALGDHDHNRQGMNLGADDYLTKPVDSNELLAAIKSRQVKLAAMNTSSQQQLSKLQGKFTQEMPEEFVEPLSIILMSSEILIKHSAAISPEQLAEIGLNINKTAKRLNRLIQNYLLDSKLELIAKDPKKIKVLRKNHINKSRLALIELNLNTMAKEKAQEYSRERDLIVQFENVTACISEEYLKKIAEELLDNAFKFSRTGTPVTLLAGYNQNHDHYLLACSNYGAEIEQKVIDKLTIPSSQDSSTLEDKTTGLGLTIVKRLAELHGGELKFSYRTNWQTSVGVILPLG